MVNEGLQGQLDYRAINVLEAMFRFRICEFETEFMFSDGSTRIYTNWDVKGVRERHYMEQYKAVPVEEYLRSAVDAREIVEYGITASDVRRFIEGKSVMFEDLLLDAADNTPLDAD